MKGITSKIIVLCCAGILSVTAALLPWHSDGVSAGAGNGRDEKIETIQDVSALLECFDEQLTGYVYPDKSAPGSAHLIDPSVSRTAVEESRDKDSTEYKSVTLNENSTYKVFFSSINQGTSNSTELKGKRGLDIYISEDAVYYESDLTLMSKSTTVKEGERESHSAYLSLVMKIYMSKTAVLLRMDKLEDVIDGKAIVGTNQFLGRWVDLTSSKELTIEDVVDGIVSVNDENFKILDLMGQYIRKTDSAFDERDGVYTMKESTFRAFMSSLLSIMGVGGTLDENAKGSFSVDLHDPVKPKINFDISNSYEAKLNGPSVSAECSEVDDFLLCNINNTVINAPSAENALTPEEFQEIMEEMMS